MKLYTKKGAKVRFIGKNGYPAELERAMGILEVGGEYEVLGMDVGGWSSSVRLSGGCFNSVMFENVDE